MEKNLFINSQINRVKSIKDGGGLYFIYFRLSQIITLVVALFVVGTMATVIIPMESFQLPLMSFLLSAVALIFSLALSEFCLRSMDKGKTVGLYVGLILCVFQLFGMGFPMALFGFYAFLNPAAQKKFLTDAPPWFKDVLSNLRINFTEQVTEK